MTLQKEAFTSTSLEGNIFLSRSDRRSLAINEKMEDKGKDVRIL